MVSADCLAHGMRKGWEGREEVSIGPKMWKLSLVLSTRTFSQIKVSEAVEECHFAS